MLGDLSAGDTPPIEGLIFELADRWHTPPWVIEDEMTERWWYWWLDYRAALLRKQQRDAPTT